MGWRRRENTEGKETGVSMQDQKTRVHRGTGNNACHSWLLHTFQEQHHSVCVCTSSQSMSVRMRTT